MIGSTEELAHHVIGLQPDDLPEDVRERALRSIADTLCAGIYGGSTKQGHILAEEAEGRYLPGDAYLWGRRGQLAPAGAALVNAAQAHAFELDDYLPAGKTHPGAVVVSTALALAEAQSSVDDLVVAIVAGYDAMSRVALAMNPVCARRRGFHITGLSGPFGSAATAGRLLECNVDEMVSAFGIASSCSSGTFAFTAEGSMTKPLHAGRAAEAGIVATQLARRGFHGPREPLTASDGGLLKAVSDDPRPAELVTELGSRFDIAQAAIKPYSCCGSIHSSIDAIFELRDVHGLVAKDIRSIVVHNAGGVISQCGFRYVGSGGQLEAQMSMQYCLAAAALDGQIGRRQFSDVRRQDPVLLDLARRVECVVDPEIEAQYPRRFPSRVVVQTTSGRSLESRVAAPVGTPERPLDDEAFHDKLKDLMDGLMPPALAGELIDVLDGLRESPSLTGLATVLEEVGRERGRAQMAGLIG